VETYTPQEVAISARCNTACLLVLTDLHYPGWQVSVDGHEQPIHRVNGLYRGVALEPGAHRVVYRYAPAALRLGLWLALAALLLAAGAPLGHRLLRRHSI
jgi:uncharacterized membrane protein YfhO